MHVHEASETIFHFNADFSGDVVIIRKSTKVTVPAADVLEFVACCFLQNKLVEKLEDMDWKETLQLFKK